jgi:hypothetical protein
MNEEQFYQECAISALQGIMEMGGKLGVIAELLPEKVAEHAFDFADHMLEEYRKRRPGLKF